MSDVIDFAVPYEACTNDVLVHMIHEEDQKAGAIILPGSMTRNQFKVGVIIKAGPAPWRDGQRMPVEYNVGDTVLFRCNTEKENVFIGGRSFFLTDYGSLCGKILKEPTVQKP